MTCAQPRPARVRTRGLARRPLRLWGRRPPDSTSVLLPRAQALQLAEAASIPSPCLHPQTQDARGPPVPFSAVCWGVGRDLTPSVLR